MKMPLKLICSSTKVRRDGTSKIYIQYCFTSTVKALLDTSIEIPPEYWDEDDGCISEKMPSKYGNAEEMNDNLLLQMRIAEDIVRFATRRKLEDGLAFVKNTFAPDFDIRKLDEIAQIQDSKDYKVNLDLHFQIDHYISSKIRKVCKDMPRIYRNMKDHLQEFEAFKGVKLTFDHLDLTFYEEFVDFLQYEYIQKGRKKEVIVGLKTNTVGKTIKQFRTFLRDRIRKRIIPPIDMDGWTIVEEEVDAVYLDWNEIDAICKVDLSNRPHLAIYRDDFVVGCLTGLRFSDFSNLSETDVRGDMLYKKQQKSDHRVVIPLRPQAAEILKQKFIKGSQTPSNGHFNYGIKEIAKLAGLTEMITHSHKKGNVNIVETKPKYAWITSHSCRRSFCTNEFLAGTPVELIMKISGHKSVKDFYKYIRITPEEAANKIKLIWTKREMERVN